MRKIILLTILFSLILLSNALIASNKLQTKKFTLTPYFLVEKNVSASTIENYDSQDIPQPNIASLGLILKKSNIFLEVNHF